MRVTQASSLGSDRSYAFNWRSKTGSLHLAVLIPPQTTDQLGGIDLQSFSDPQQARQAEVSGQGFPSRVGILTDPQRILFESRGHFGGVRARRIHVPSKAQMPKVSVGPGVTSPKSRSSGCRAGHAGYESFPLVLPGPYLCASTRSWR
jgi:hypothetical protein